MGKIKIRNGMQLKANRVGGRSGHGVDPDDMSGETSEAETRVTNFSLGNSIACLRRLLPFLICFFLIIFLQKISFALEKHETLSDLTKTALENNPDLLAARKNYEAALTKIPQMGSLEEPKIGVKFQNVPGGSLQPGLSDMAMYSISQEFPFLGKRYLRAKTAIYRAKMQEVVFRAKEREIIYQVKEAFYDLIFHDQGLKIARKNKELLKDFTKIAQAKYSVGLVSQQDVLKANVEFAKLIGEEIMHEQEETIHLAHLNTLLARDPKTKIMHHQEWVLADITYTFEDVKQTALSNRPELLEMNTAILMSKAEKELAQREYFPDLMSMYEARYDRGGIYQNYDLTLSINFPLWFWSKGKFDAMFKEAKFNIARYDALYQSMKNMTLFDLTETWTMIETQKKLVDLYKTTIMLQSEQLVRTAKVGYETGKVDFLDLLDSFRMLYENKLEYYENLKKLNVAVAKLERIVGVDL